MSIEAQNPPHAIIESSGIGGPYSGDPYSGDL